ncbi:hypothetical protein ACFFGH_21600 [Lysobacter korlensis]|uniref:Septum formation-related domain-containing protein n=1 Tax=Lysobacter korlensis TaxID=553636 RepID=A0ABV6RTX6_9GAMM
MTDDTDRPRRARRSAGAGDPARTETSAAVPIAATGAARQDEGPATEAFRWDAPAEDDATQAFRWDVDGPDTDPAPVDPSLDGAPFPEGQPPTEAMAWETAVVPAVAPGGPVPRSPMPGTRPETGPTGIEALFQPGQFRDFETTAVLPQKTPPAGATAVRAARTRPSLTSAQRSLLWAAGILVAILVLIALFAIGRRLPAMFAAPQPVETSTPTPTPTPTPVDPAAGPVAPGGYAWDELRGGECLDPYESAWQEDYTVVECSGPHAAQLLVRGMFPDEVAPDGTYPGFEELAGQINLLCTDPSVIDYGAARQFDDIVVEGAHAVNAEEWDEGHQEYFCFLTRSGGDPLEGTLAVPPAG